MIATTTECCVCAFPIFHTDIFLYQIGDFVQQIVCFAHTSEALQIPNATATSTCFEWDSFEVTNTFPRAYAYAFLRTFRLKNALWVNM